MVHEVLPPSADRPPVVAPGTPVLPPVTVSATLDRPPVVAEPPALDAPATLAMPPPVWPEDDVAPAAELAPVLDNVAEAVPPTVYRAPLAAPTMLDRSPEVPPADELPTAEVMPDVLTPTPGMPPEESFLAAGAPPLHATSTSRAHTRGGAEPCEHETLPGFSVSHMVYASLMTATGKQALWSTASESIDSCEFPIWKKRTCRLFASRGDGADKDAIRVDITVRTAPLSAPLAIVYAHDHGDDDNVLRYLTTAEQQSLDLSDDALYELALSNLRRQLGNLKMHSVGNYFAFTCGGLFEATLMLLDEVWERTERELTDGDTVVAAVPAKDLIFFAARSNETGLNEIRALLERIEADGNLNLSRHLFARQNGTWSRL